MSERVFSVVGLFDSADALLAAIPAVRERRLGRLEAYSPYPVHGLPRPWDRAGRLWAAWCSSWVSLARSSRSPSSVGNGIDYPTVTGGKALRSWEAFVPIVFEVTVLFATFTAGVGMLVLLNRLPSSGARSCRRP